MGSAQGSWQRRESRERIVPFDTDLSRAKLGEDEPPAGGLRHSPRAGLRIGVRVSNGRSVPGFAPLP